MQEAHLFLSIAELLGIHAAAPLLLALAAGILYKRNVELQRKLFKLAHAQVLAITKLESTLETTVEALRAAARTLRDSPRDNSRDRDYDS